MTEEKIFGAIPLRTWNWLGVNDLKTSAPIEEKIIDVAPGETKKFFDVNFSGENGAKKITINVEKSGRIEFVAADFGRGNFSTELEINLTGDNSSAEVDAIYFGDGERKSDYNYIIRHRGKKTVANMNVRGALKDKSDKIFRGTLDFQRGSKGSVGREFEEVLILSDGVRNRSVPIMLAGEDDVDGHHALTVGRQDEEKIFYLMSRGLDENDAERLLVEAAFNPVVEKIDDEKIREKIFAEIQTRLGEKKFC